MKICLGFYGFIRKNITHENITSFLNILPPNSEIDIYIYTPNKFNEFDSETITYEQIHSYVCVFNNTPQIKNIFIRVYEYDPRVFILKSKEHNLPFKNAYNNLYHFRILSLHYSISTLCDIIQNSGISYDTNIITRFDIFPSIKSLGNCVHVMTDNFVYIWRTIPYESKDDAEDRIIICSQYVLNLLSQLYNNCAYNVIYCAEPFYFYSERIIGGYLKFFKDILLMDQTNIDIGLSPVIGDKYTEQFQNECYNLLKIYNIEY